MGEWFLYSLAIFGLTFAHEDVALVMAAFAILETGLPISMAALSLYCGIVASDLALYILGRLARGNSWLHRRFIGRRVVEASSWLSGNLLKVMALCRIAPGLLFATFVACGWLRISFGKFFRISMLTAAVYTPLALTAAMLLGNWLLEPLGLWAWLVTFLAMLALTLYGLLHARRISTTPTPRPQPRLSIVGRLRRRQGLRRRHQGMPSLAGLARKIAVAERIPTVLFYLPLTLRWIWLGLRYGSLTLPTIANPAIETGGFWGESKSDCMGQIGAEQQQWLAKFISLRTSLADTETATDTRLALEHMHNAGLTFPVVIKPDIGWQGFGVRLVDNTAELRDYLADFPRGEKIILQQHIPFDGEAGVFYARPPGAPQGQIYSLTLRYFPYVVGDGQATVRELILQDARARFKADYFLGGFQEHAGLSEKELESVPAGGEVVRLAFIGSIRVGGLYRDGRHLITETLTNRIDQIAQSIPEFWYGRFDIRFESIDRLQQGEGFAIIEINGAGAEAIHVWDPETPLLQTYRDLFQAQTLLFQIANANRHRGFKPMPLPAFFAYQRRQQKLIARYPAAE